MDANDCLICYSTNNLFLLKKVCKTGCTPFICVQCFYKLYKCPICKENYPEIKIYTKKHVIFPWERNLLVIFPCDGLNSTAVSDSDAVIKIKHYPHRLKINLSKIQDQRWKTAVVDLHVYTLK